MHMHVHTHTLMNTHELVHRRKGRVATVSKLYPNLSSSFVKFDIVVNTACM